MFIVIIVDDPTTLSMFEPFPKYEATKAIKTTSFSPVRNKNPYYEPLNPDVRRFVETMGIDLSNRYRHPIKPKSVNKSM